MKNITKFLSLFAIIFMAATAAFAQPVGQFKIRYVGSSATAPVGLAFNITVDRETNFIESPGYPLRMPEYTLGINKPSIIYKDQTVIVSSPGASYPGYTASSQYTLKDLKIRRGGSPIMFLRLVKLRNSPGCMTTSTL